MCGLRRYPPRASKVSPIHEFWNSPVVSLKAAGVGFPEAKEEARKKQCVQSFWQLFSTQARIFVLRPRPKLMHRDMFRHRSVSCVHLFRGCSDFFQRAVFLLAVTKLEDALFRGDRSRCYQRRGAGPSTHFEHYRKESIVQEKEGRRKVGCRPNRPGVAIFSLTSTENHSPNPFPAVVPPLSYININQSLPRLKSVVGVRARTSKCMSVAFRYEVWQASHFMSASILQESGPRRRLNFCWSVTSSPIVRSALSARI